MVERPCDLNLIQYQEKVAISLDTRERIVAKEWARFGGAVQLLLIDSARVVVDLGMLDLPLLNLKRDNADYYDDHDNCDSSVKDCW